MSFRATSVFLGLLAYGGLAQAATLWYNGDFNGDDALANERNTTINQANVYDDFIVPVGQTWTVTSVFSNDLTDISSTQAFWEIRSGVSSGNGGTVIASGTDSDTLTATGRSGAGYNEFTVLVSGLNVVLGPGTYWLTVSPIDSGSGRSFNSTTSGANSIGLPAGNDDNSFFDSTFFGAAFAPASNQVGFPADFSMGVVGTAAGSTVPEPATLLMLGSALVLLGVTSRRKTAR
jgi:hypothetical protein